MEGRDLVSRITRFALRRKVTMFMGLLTVVAIGLIATYRLPLEMSPRGLEGHYMSIFAPWNVGVPPETMDKIGLPLEEELSTVRGVDSITTHGYKSGARVELRFRYGTDMDVAYREVRDRVERARARFPEGTDKPFIYKHRPGAEPVVSFRISYDPDSDYYELIDKHVITPIQRIDGVADVDFRIYQREIRIQVDKDRADAHGISMNEIANLLRSDNFTLASGSVVDGGKKYALKSQSAFRTMEEIRNLPLRADLLLRDVATLTYEPEEADRLYRYNAQPANGINVNREGEANTVEVSRRVTEAIREIQQNPRMQGFDLSVYENQGEEIIKRLQGLISNGKNGALLAAVVLFFFLRQFRMTLVISMAIPLCLLVALTALFFGGKTLNGLTIMGLVLCVGLLVDNSVVVAENIHRHHTNGLSRWDACMRGVSEIGFAITIATLTTLIVFGAAMMSEGEMRVYIQTLSLPVIVAILASLGTALMFIPLCVYLTLPGRKDDSGSGRRSLSRVLGMFFARLYAWTFDRLNRGYNRALAFFLGHRVDLTLILVALLGVTYLVAGTLNRTRKQEELIRYFSINVDFPPHYTMDQRLAYFKKVEALMERNADLYDLKAHEVHYGKWYGRFAGFFDVDRVSDLTRQEAIDRIYNDFPEEPGVRVRYKGKEGDEEEDDSQSMHHIRLVGDDPELLKKVAADLKPLFELVPGVVSFMDSADDEEGPSELAVYVDREKANSIGVNPSTLAWTIGSAVRGQNLPRFNNKGRQVPVRLLYEEEDRSDIEDVSNFMVPTEDGRWSTVGAITRTTFLKNEDEAIRRHNKKVQEWFGMKIEPGPEAWKTKYAIEEMKAAIELPEGVSFDEANVSFEDEDHRRGVAMLAVAVVFVYMLMAFFFESTLTPLSIILTVPLASVGAVLALKVTDTYLDEMVYTGGLLLVGIVVNNGIVLVDYANRLRRSGLGRSDAFLTAARHRFRPIIMTALTTICGMIPLTFGSSEGMDINFQSFGLVLIGGMTSATLFTILAIPVFYTLIEDAQIAVGNILSGVIQRPREGDSTGASVR